LTKLRTIYNVTKNTIFSIPLNLGLPTKPKYLWFGTTDKCNSRCKTCNIWKQSPTLPSELISLGDLRRCLKNPLMSKIKYILNSGGESTLINLENYLLIEHTALPKAILQISSNALLPERLASIVQYAMNINVKHLDVGLSIDGIGKAHDSVRGVNGNFKKLEIAIKLLNKLKQEYPHRIFLTLGSTLTDVTAKEAKNLYTYSKNIGIPFMWHWFNSSSFYKNENRKDINISDVIRDYPTKNLYMDSWYQSLITGKIPKFKCRALNTFMVIKCNGDIVPCLSRWSKPIGNIKKESISDIWCSNSAYEEIDKIKKCPGCLNSWGWSWSVNETFYPILSDIIKRKFKSKEEEFHGFHEGQI